MGSRFSWISEEEVRKRLIAAGMYTVQPSKVFGYQVVIAVGGGLLWVWMAGLAGASLLTIVLGAVVIAAAGLLLPIAFIDHRIRQRHDLIERGLPDLIDLIVVTLEAGLSFPQSMKMAAARVHGPLSQEMRITLQEQNMGLTMSEALTNLQTRADTPGIRLFTRSVIQGEILGISIGQIMRNLAVEMRKRRKAYAEERAQKAPVKMLFPMIFLIFPAIFIVLLVPVVITIIDAFSTPVRTAELTLRREDGRVVCESVRVADTTLRRLRGLLGRGSLPPDQGMLLRPAWSIHTWFMRFPIDVVFLDPEQVVVKIERDVSPFKTATCRGAREVIELASGECARRGLELGDRVAWAARSHRDAADTGETALDALAGTVPADQAVLVVSGDPRFAKLVRFLLEGRNIAVTVVSSNQAADAAGSRAFTAVVIDAGTDIPDALRLAERGPGRVDGPRSDRAGGWRRRRPGRPSGLRQVGRDRAARAEIERLATSARDSNGA